MKTSTDYHCYSIQNYLYLIGSFFLSYFLVVILFSASTSVNSSLYWSYFTLSISSLSGLFACYYMVLRKLGSKGLCVVLCAFIFKQFIGTWHFVGLIQPTYFQGNTEYTFLKDYYWMHDSVSYLSSRIHEVGFLSALDFDFFVLNKGAVIFYLYSPFYFFGGDLVLNLSHISNLFSLFAAMLTTFMASTVYKLTKKQELLLLLLACFFPFSLIISAPSRDYAGQFFIALGMLSLLFSIKNGRLFLLLLVSCFLFFVQRKIYVIIPVITYILFLAIQFFSKNVKKDFFYWLRLGIICAFAFYSLRIYQFLEKLEIFDVNSVVDSNYTTDIRGLSFYFLFPIFFFKGILGAFPWTQFFEFTQESAYQVIDYFLSTFLFSMMTLTLINFSKFKKISNLLNPINISGLLICLFGLGSGYMHLAYIAMPFLFFIPVIVQYTGMNLFVVVYFCIFILFALLSIFWVELGLQGAGIWYFIKS